jgi:hypothetical protein
MRLRAGDWVEVRSAEEILRALDARGSVENLPFMPEMLQFCGRRFRVQAVAHKTCDTVLNAGGRRMQRTVHLQELRCNGSAHGDCQAACLLFWKTDWLKKVDQAQDARAANSAPSLPERDVCNSTDLLRQTQVGTGPSGNIRYSCQATRLLEATRRLPWWDVRQYVRDIVTRNVPVTHAMRVLVLSWFRALTRLGIGYRIARRVYDGVHRLITAAAAPGGAGLGSAGTPAWTGELNLARGEWVRVRPYAEIQQTLNRNSKNRGLWFDDEMVQHCGRRYRVLGRVRQIINEKTGEMMKMQNPCIVLDGVNCTASYTTYRLLCPRSIVTYWREVWLERVAESPRQTAGSVES